MKTKHIKSISKIILIAPTLTIEKTSKGIKVNLKKQGVKFRFENGDIGAVFDVFFKKNYEIKYKHHKKILENYYSDLVKKGRLPIIYDFGAHIGSSAVFFAKKYQKSKIIAIEPSKTNYDLLVQNTKSIPIINPINKAIFPKTNLEGEIYCSTDSWGDNIFNTKNKNSSQRISNFLHEFNSNYSKNEVMFICKVDIEGAEKYLFDVDFWEILNSFKCVMIEFHDWLFPNKKISENALKWIASKNREVIIQNEMVYVFNY